jgi:hypothetical protein
MRLYESPNYTVLFKDKNFEIRSYDEFMLATTKTKKDPKQSSGFNNIFNYITGDNNTNQKISMTTPVISTQEDNKLITSFYMPTRFNEDNLPKPNSNNVYIERFEKALFGVIKFSGSWKEKNYLKHDLLLKQYIERNGYNIISKRYLFRYQPPFIPSVFRRNELAYIIEKKE